MAIIIEMVQIDNRRENERRRVVRYTELLSSTMNSFSCFALKARSSRRYTRIQLMSLVHSQSLLSTVRETSGSWSSLAIFGRLCCRNLRNWSCKANFCRSEGRAIDGVSWISQFSMGLMGFVSILGLPVGHLKASVIVVKAVARPLDIARVGALGSECTEDGIW